MLTEEEYQVGINIIKYVIKRNQGRLRSFEIDEEEAFSAGLVGLAKSIKEYDEATCPISWLTFTYQYIWASIFSSDTSARAKSLRRIKMDSGIYRIRDLYYKKTGWELTDEKLAHLLDANDMFPKILKDHFRKTESLPYVVGGGYNDEEYLSLPIIDSRVPLPEEAGTLNKEYFVETIHDIVNNTDILDEIERGIINLYYGFDEPRLNFRKIARRLHRNENIIREFFNEAIEKLSCDSRLEELHLDLVET